MPNNEERPQPQTEITLKIANKKGLHARAAAKFVKTASSFDARIMVAKILAADGKPVTDVHEVSASSILGLMMLGAERNSTLRLRASGAQADEAANTVANLIKSKFGED